MLYKKTIKKYYTPPGTICLNQSLLLRLLEYIKENPTITDAEIHKVVEVAANWSQKYETLNMDAYQSIISGVNPT